MISKEKLLDKLDEDLAWRKKELDLILKRVKSSSKNTLISNLRVGIAILYAHWEGYIKSSARLYLEFIKDCKLKYNELEINLIALSMKAKIDNCMHAHKSKIHQETINFLLNNLNSIAKIPYKKSIRTKSNLTFEIFEEILIKLGLNVSDYELKRNLINKKLVYIRNNVAHGSYISIKEKEYINLHENIILIIDKFKSQIIEFAILKKFMRK